MSLRAFVNRVSLSNVDDLLVSRWKAVLIGPALAVSIGNFNLITLREDERVILHPDVLIARPESNAERAPIIVFGDISKGIVIPIAAV